MPAPPLPLGDRSPCPIANALDVVGDRWTLLVIRDLLFFRKVRFKDLLASAEGIPTNILADRLRRLETAGLVEKKAYQARPPRSEYRLTRRGFDLLPLLREMIVWANRHIAGTGNPPAGFLDRLEAASREPAGRIRSARQVEPGRARSEAVQRRRPRRT